MTVSFEFMAPAWKRPHGVEVVGGSQVIQALSDLLGAQISLTALEEFMVIAFVPEIWVFEKNDQNAPLSASKCH